MNPLETYLKELSEIRSSGAAVKETSYYGALANLLNEIGKTLYSKLRCIINLQDQEPGLPHWGPFTPDQFQEPAKADYWDRYRQGIHTRDAYTTGLGFCIEGMLVPSISDCI